MPPLLTLRELLDAFRVHVNAFLAELPSLPSLPTSISLPSLPLASLSAVSLLDHGHAHGFGYEYTSRDGKGQGEEESGAGSLGMRTCCWSGGIIRGLWKDIGASILSCVSFPIPSRRAFALFSSLSLLRMTPARPDVHRGRGHERGHVI
jgi:hypothetical protein